MALEFYPDSEEIRGPMTSTSGGPHSAASPAGSSPARSDGVRIFIDQANLDLTMRSQARNRGVAWNGFDWTMLTGWLVRQTESVCQLSAAVHEGTRVYASFDQSDPAHANRRKWLQWLDRQPGIQVVTSQMRPRPSPTCQQCHRKIDDCPHCGAKLRLRVEKGVDTAIVTDMIALAWQGAYDIAVLASSDSDFIPAVQLLDQRGLKVVQAGFPPVGDELRRACWGQIDVFKGHADLAR